jgi:mannose-1-phosphate guanylyltransferase
MYQNFYALILAGGSGERFWPLSRRSRPKQLLSLFSDETLLESTLPRLQGLVPSENILILTNSQQEEAVRRLLPYLPAENIIAEPAKRDTAAAITLGAAVISRRNPQATMVVLPADHLIRDVSGFQQTLKTAADAAQAAESIVTIGIQPTWPCPSYGYIERGHLVQASDLRPDAPPISTATPVYEVKRFREKPNQELAESFLKQGGFCWNGGMFVWTMPTIIRELTQNAPDLAAFFLKLQTSADINECIQAEFPTLPKISFDYAIMEGAKRVLEVDAQFDWDDVGSWISAGKYWNQDEALNATNGSLTAVESGGNIICTEKGVHVALLGVHNLILVQTKDAILICNRPEAEKIKEVVQKIPAELQ